MKKLKSRDIVRLMREEYERKLKNQLHEVEVFNSKGKMVIGKDLKVKHEPSGFIYTVKGVTGEPGSAKIVLRAPEEPRVQPQGEVEDAYATPARSSGKIPGIAVPPLRDEVMEDSDPESDDEKEDKRDYGKKAYPSEKQPPSQDKGETMFVVDQKEFEKHYKEA
jgi:hypothetical protein